MYDQSTTTLAEFLGPIFKFFEARGGDTWSDVDQTGLKVCDIDRPDIVW